MFSVHPYGGVGQIGANSTLFTLANKKILIDAGALFPLEEGLGVNILVPKYEDLKQLDGIVITHGHEDHIGGLEVLLRKFPAVSIYTSNFTAKMLRKKNIEKHNITVVNESSIVSFGHWKFSPFYVDHSIPETFAAVLSNEHENCCIFFVPDFKINVAKGSNSAFSFERIRILAAKFKNKILFADSTNILSLQLKTPSEYELIAPLRKLFSQSEGRIIATFFPSNVERLKTFLDLAIENKLPVSLLGRSMKFFADLALETGHIRNIPKIADIILPHQRSLILASGCQGDFKGTLRGIILDDSTKLKLDSKDIFIYSAKVIPGNDKKVGLIFNKIIHSQASLYHSDNYTTHVSGHAGREDLNLLISNFCPQKIIPIHTESHFLPAFREWQKKEFPQVQHIEFSNGDTLVIDGDKYELKDSHENWQFNIIHDNGNLMDKHELRERRKLAENGVVSLAFLQKKGKPTYQFTFLGLPFAIEDRADFDAYIYSVLSNTKSPKDQKFIEKKVKEYFMEKYSFRPNVAVMIL
ncbi:MAG: ribonuclease J [Bdellovibrio sp.]|nr:ribonuclease J [Bdellovibrio sp.]